MQLATRSKCLASVAAFVCLGLSAQSIPPGEIHSRTIAYVPPPGVTLRTEVRIVEVPVVIRDANLQGVDGLQRDDFEIYDDSKKQPITAFSVHHSSRIESAPGIAGGEARKDQSRPRFLALTFDDLHLLPAPLNSVKDAAKRFVRTSLEPGDRVVVVRTSKSEDAKFISNVTALVSRSTRWPRP
jgi:VWFA-related protein